MALSGKAKKKKYIYTDYITWPDDERWELIEGEVYNMAPAPSFRHQRIVGNLYRILGNKLAGKPCIPELAPTDVIFSEYDVVQPDVFVVCDHSKITEANIQGAPDIIVEVLSPFTALKDKREKKFLYEKFGVKEFILIDPIEQYVECFYLMEDRTYSKGEVRGPQETLILYTLDKLEIPLWEIFEIEKNRD